MWEALLAPKLGPTVLSLQLMKGLGVSHLPPVPSREYPASCHGRHPSCSLQLAPLPRPGPHARWPRAEPSGPGGCHRPRAACHTACVQVPTLHLGGRLTPAPPLQAPQPFLLTSPCLLGLLVLPALVEVLHHHTHKHVEHKEADDEQEGDEVQQHPGVMVGHRLQGGRLRAEGADQHSKATDGQPASEV